MALDGTVDESKGLDPNSQCFLVSGKIKVLFSDLVITINTFLPFRVIRKHPSDRPWIARKIQMWIHMRQSAFVIQNYTYLGTCISSTGTFTTLSLDHLRQNTLHALFSLRRDTHFKGLKPSLASKIFDSMISNSNVQSVKSGVPLLSRISNPRTTLQSKKLIYNSVNDIWKCITKRQIWQVQLNLVNIP